jgi:hypothetical protein
MTRPAIVPPSRLLVIGFLVLPKYDIATTHPEPIQVIPKSISGMALSCERYFLDFFGWKRSQKNNPPFRLWKIN